MSGPDNLENVSGWYGKCPDYLRNVWMIWKVLVQSKKYPDNLENVSCWSGKCPDDLESFLMI